MTRYPWGATVAMSWLWGLGFFFSIHFAHAYGWLGLVAFAVPNALGLLLFGVGLERLRQRHDLRDWIEARLKQAPLVFLSYQVVAVSLTLFALIKYLLIEVGVDVAIVWGLALLCVGMLTAEMLGFHGVVRLHALFYVVFVAAGLALLLLAPSPELRPARGGYDLTFFGFLVPLAAGLLFGPWLDLQQWQRALAMSEAGFSVERGFAVGAALFFVVLLLVGGLSIALVPDGLIAPLSQLDGRAHGQGLLTAALMEGGDAVPLLLFALLAGLAILSTLDSAQLALRWYFEHLNRTSLSPLLGMLPESLRATTLPAFAIAAAIAWGALALGADLEHFMIFFATLFLVNAAVLLLAAFWPASTPRSGSVIFLTGAVSMAVMMIGYFEAQPLAMIVAVALPLILLLPKGATREGGQASMQAAWQQTVAVAAPQGGSRLGESESRLERRASADLGTLSGEVTALRQAAEHGEGATSAGPAEPTTGWFDATWFTIPLVPTYSDTNSVGNVYFANYVGWVGKARELFFRACMPDFNLQSTDFYILTRSFNHKFVTEIREFQDVRVRLRISGYNRKFVKLQHEIRGVDGSLVGNGEQALMFVNATDYALIDIPGKVYSAFIKYAPAPTGAKA